MYHYSEKTIKRKKFLVECEIGRLFWNVAYWLSSGYNERPAWAFGVLVGLIVLLACLLNIAGVATKSSFFLALDYLPFVTTSKESLYNIIHGASYSNVQKAVIAGGQIWITLQLALFIMSVRNKLRR